MTAPRWRRRGRGPEHHPVFAKLAGGTGPLPNWLGVSTRRGFFDPELPFVSMSFPPIDDQYLEWIDVLEAVTLAEGTFTMLELGAGYGRWVVNAAAAVRAYSGIDCRLVAVEAEPTHFQWLGEHCADNGVEAELIRAAVSATAGEVPFAVGNPSGWYGQSMVESPGEGDEVTNVRAVTLSSLLAPFDRADLIHADIQGAEADVFEEAAAALEVVRRCHIGTHGREQEARLRALFGGLGWRCLNDYRSNAVAKTPWGSLEFQDGIQTWLNPSFPV
jgi:FkbM family methyltransferase